MPNPYILLSIIPQKESSDLTIRQTGIIITPIPTLFTAFVW